MFSPAAMIYPQAKVLQIPPDRIHVSKVVWALSDDEGPHRSIRRVFTRITGELDKSSLLSRMKPLQKHCGL